MILRNVDSFAESLRQMSSFPQRKIKQTVLDVDGNAEAVSESLTPNLTPHGTFKLQIRKVDGIKELDNWKK